MFTPDKLVAMGKFVAEGGRKVAPEIASVAENAIKKMSAPFVDGIHPQQELIDALRKQGTKHINAYNQRNINPMSADVEHFNTQDLLGGIHPFLPMHTTNLKNPYKGMADLPHTLASIIENNPTLKVDSISNVIARDKNFVNNGTIKVNSINKTLKELSALPENDVAYIDDFLSSNINPSVDVKVPLHIVAKRNSISNPEQLTIFEGLLNDTMNTNPSITKQDVEDAYTAAQLLMSRP